MSLYTINQDLEQVLNAIFESTDEETGEVDESLVQVLEDLQLQKAEKLDNIGAFYKNLLAEADMLKKEEEALKARRQAKERKAEQLKNYVASVLNGEKFESSRVAFSWRKSNQVVIDEPYIENIPEEYLKYKDPDINKAKLKEDLKKGINLEGIAHLEDKNNLQIK